MREQPLRVKPQRFFYMGAYATPNLKVGADGERWVGGGIASEGDFSYTLGQFFPHFIKRILGIMPLMTKIRENLSTFFSVFAGLFVVYIVLDWGMDITGRRHSTRLAESQQVGSVDGIPIMIKDFNDLVKRAIDNQKAQTGTDPDDEQQRLIRDQLWNQEVEQILMDEQVQRLGIKVPDEEIVDWVKGDNPPDFLKQRFIDSAGTFNRQMYLTAIMDPRNKAVMIQVEEGLRKQREREKLQSLLMATVQVDEGEIRQRFADQNIKIDASYVFFDPNTLLRDDEVKYTDDDLRRYYNEHSEEFKIESSRKLRYVLFREIPSKSDTAAALADAADILKRTRAGVDFSELARTYSDTPPLDSIFHKRGEINGEKEDSIFAASPGDLIGPIREKDGFHVIKVLEFRNGKDEFIRASHILVKIDGTDSVAALKKAKALLAEAKAGKDFAALAKASSMDPGSAARGGDLGWFGKGRMVKQFEEAAFKAKIGQLVGPVRTPFGYHIIKVLAKDSREARFTDINLMIHVSTDTKSDISQKAQEFSYLAKQEGGFEKEAQSAKYQVSETPSFLKNATVPGIGTNVAVSKFAFNNRLGTVSDPITLENGAGVFMVSEVKNAGIQPFDQLKATIDLRVKREKKIEKLKEIVAELRRSIGPADTLAKVQTRFPNVRIEHPAPFTPGSSLPDVGRDPGFMGGIQNLKPGETSGPIETDRGVYLARLWNESAFDTTAYRTQHDNLRTQLLNERKGRLFSDWSDQLKKAADIVDNRDIVYH